MNPQIKSLALFKLVAFVPKYPSSRVECYQDGQLQVASIIGYSVISSISVSGVDTTSQTDNTPSVAATISSSERRISKAGSVFVRDSSIPALGEAYRDKSGLIWGDVAKDKDGKILRMNHKNAIAYCEKLNKDFPKFEIRLPTKEDFIRLRTNLGSEIGNKINKAAKGYSPKGKSGKEILPNLSKADWQWSSAADPDRSSLAYIFNGRSGVILSDYRYYNGIAVRCVASRR